MDHFLFSLHKQESIKHNFAIGLYVVVKLAFWIMGHDLRDSGIRKSDFDFYSTCIWLIYTINIQEHHIDIFKVQNR